MVAHVRALKPRLVFRAALRQAAGDKGANIKFNAAKTLGTVLPLLTADKRAGMQTVRQAIRTALEGLMQVGAP